MPPFVRRGRPALVVTLVALALGALPHAVRAQAAAPYPERTPYGSWGEAARDAAQARDAGALARPSNGRYQPGDAVIADPDGNGKVYRMHVVGAESDGRLRAHYDGFGPGWTTLLDPPKLLGFQPEVVPAPRVAAAAANDRSPSAKPPAPGKYGCVESQYRVVSGTFEFTPRGSVVLGADGAYEYTGTSSRGRWRWDAAAGAIRFTAGRLDGARAVRIDDSAKWRFELPTGDPKRPLKWSCGPV